MHHQGNGNHDGHETGYSDELHERGNLAGLVGDDIARADHLRDIVNGRAEENAGRNVVVLKVGNEHRVRDHRHRAERGHARNGQDGVALVILVLRQYGRDQSAHQYRCNDGGNDQGECLPAELHDLGRRDPYAE